MPRSENVLLIGYFMSHTVGSKVELLKAMGYNVHAFEVGSYNLTENVYSPDSVHTLKKYKKWKGYYKIEEIKKILRNFEFINEEESISDMALHLMKEIEPDIIWGVWGAGILEWLRTFRRCGFRGRIVWTANVFPNRIKYMKWSSERGLYNKWLHKIDGLILTEHRMLEFIQREYPKTKYTKYLLLPDYYPRSWFAKTVDVLANNNEPHIVYLGAPERYGYAMGIDRVDSYLLQMAKNGIHVHCAKPRKAAINHPLIHFYDRFHDASFVNGEFGQFINQFDASIVLYNYKGYHPRFASTFPTRFLVSLCGCIPIFVKKGPLLSCEAFVEENGIGKSYSDANELKCMLSNQDLMKQLKENAANNNQYFSSDCSTNYECIRDFLEKL